MKETDRADQPPGQAADSVVKKGGIARAEADAEDVTRDTYGFSESDPPAPTPEERFAEAERVAAAEGIPGIVTPDDLLRSDAGAGVAPVASGAGSPAGVREEDDDVEGADA
jgi:hypothetical protein